MRDRRRRGAASGAPVVVTGRRRPEIVAAPRPGADDRAPGDAGPLAGAIVRIAPVTTDAWKAPHWNPAATGRMAEIFREGAEDGHGRRWARSALRRPTGVGP